MVVFMYRAFHSCICILVLHGSLCLSFQKFGRTLPHFDSVPSECESLLRSCKAIPMLVRAFRGALAARVRPIRCDRLPVMRYLARPVASDGMSPAWNQSSSMAAGKQQVIQ